MSFSIPLADHTPKTLARDSIPSPPAKGRLMNIILQETGASAFVTSLAIVIVTLVIAVGPLLVG
jgi:hypothetical protein